MKKYVLATLLALSFSLHAEESALDNIDKAKVAETLGHLIVRHLVNPGFELDVERIIAGIQDEKEGKPSPLSEDEYEKAIYAIQEYMFNKDAEKNLSEANAFLQKNVQESGIRAIDEQLQYKVAQEGSGEIVSEDSTPMIRYEGKLMDGTIFASCINDEAMPLPMQQTIPGFAKGLVGMKEGEKRTLYIHPELAYGVAGHLPPNSLLIFDVEVVKANASEEELAKIMMPMDAFDDSAFDIDEELL